MDRLKNKKILASRLQLVFYTGNGIVVGQVFKKNLILPPPTDTNKTKKNFDEKKMKEVCKFYGNISCFFTRSCTVHVT